MYIPIELRRDFLDILSLVLNFILGTVAIISLWLSRKALKKSEFDSAMSTSPSIIIRPCDYWIEVKRDVSSGGRIIGSGENIKENDFLDDMGFGIAFEYFNAGRGVAFNVSNIKIRGGKPMSTSHTPALYLTNEDGAKRFNVMIKISFREVYRLAESNIPISIGLSYTNDQNNIFCKSSWSADIRLFNRVADGLEVREKCLLGRKGKIEYSQKPFNS